MRVAWGNVPWGVLLGCCLQPSRAQGSHKRVAERPLPSRTAGAPHGGALLGLSRLHRAAPQSGAALQWRPLPGSLTLGLNVMTLPAQHSVSVPGPHHTLLSHCDLSHSLGPWEGGLLSQVGIMCL